VYVIEQQNPHNGIYDEQKAMLCFSNQRLAEQAYKHHYDMPDRYMLTTEPMDIEAFKRWVAITEPKEGELIKAVEPKDGLKLVILEKALAPEIGASTSPAGNRAPGPGAGVNYVIPLPVKPKPKSIKKTGYSPDVEELLRDKASFLGEPLKVDKEIYEMLERLLKVQPYEVGEHAQEMHEQGRDSKKANRDWLEREARHNRPAKGNKADVADKKPKVEEFPK
jgi:hypothetical protein